MRDSENYLALLDEYTRVVQLVYRQGVELQHSEGIRSRAMEVYGGIAFRLEELRGALMNALSSPPSSAQQSGFEVDALEVAEQIDDLLYQILREKNMRGLWEQHVHEAMSIVGRWPGVPPKRLRTPGG